MSTEIILDVDTIQSQLDDGIEDTMLEVLETLTSYTLDRISTISSQKLSITNYQEYRRSIEVSRRGFEVDISLNDPKMIRLEEGIDSYDMKIGLLNSPKVKRNTKLDGSAGTPHIDVPFKHTLSKRGVGNHIKPTNMRTAVKKAMSKASSTGKHQRLFPKNKTGSSGKVTDLIVSPPLKISDSNKSRLTTIRRVSHNSKPQSWIHPGMEGVGVFEQVSNELSDIKDDVVQGIIDRRKA